jgi:septation ring formation regulator EzrA
VDTVQPPTLTSALSADYEALKNDLLEANEMTAALQRELAGKSNEFALLRQVFEKTREDLEHLQAGIRTLRAERHVLANHLMRTTALQEELEELTKERDTLRKALDGRDILNGELTVKLNQANAALAEAQRRAREPKWIG